MDSELYVQLVIAILKGQEGIIGPVAWQQAATVPGLIVLDSGDVEFSGSDKKKIIDDLVMKFNDFFGPAAVEVCKESSHKVTRGVDPEALPSSLR